MKDFYFLKLRHDDPKTFIETRKMFNSTRIIRMTWYLLEKIVNTEKYYVIISENEMSLYRSCIKEIYRYSFSKVKLTLKEENGVVYCAFYDGSSSYVGDVIYRFDKKPSILMIEEVLPELFL